MFPFLIHHLNSQYDSKSESNFLIDSGVLLALCVWVFICIAVYNFKYYIRHHPANPYYSYIKVDDVFINDGRFGLGKLYNPNNQFKPYSSYDFATDTVNATHIYKIISISGDSCKYERNYLTFTDTTWINNKKITKYSYKYINSVDTTSNLCLTILQRYDRLPKNVHVILKENYTGSSINVKYYTNTAK